MKSKFRIFFWHFRRSKAAADSLSTYTTGNLALAKANYSPVGVPRQASYIKHSRCMVVKNLILTHSVPESCFPHSQCPTRFLASEFPRTSTSLAVLHDHVAFLNIVCALKCQKALSHDTARDITMQYCLKSRLSWNKHNCLRRWNYQ